MSVAYFRFYAELNDFLAPARRMLTFAHSFRGRVSIKDMIEALGVPHTEVDLILVNGVSVDFSYLVRSADRVSVYPVFESLDITPVLRVRPHPLRETRFVLDIHLGKLARYLRLLGFDSLYRNDFEDEELVNLSSRQGRILLTRDRGLLKRSLVTHGYCLRETNSQRQLTEVLRRFDLFGSVHPFQRCLRCNGVLERAEKATIQAQLLSATRQYFEDFRWCSGCGKIYWQGSHYQRMQEFIEKLVQHRRGLTSSPSVTRARREG
ncbi:MAG: twitching motility protein PilT [Acidobacteria bacterium]|nr:MAG: twitching motility protein PilT [Acidobacteriota bacterium]